MSNNDHQFLIEAFIKVGLYTPAEASILKKMLEIETKGIVLVPAKTLKQVLNLSHTAIYSSLKTLQLKGVITKLSDQPHSYKINYLKLEEAISLYKKIKP
jgi:predicted transcriptional regulator